MLTFNKRTLLTLLGQTDCKESTGRVCANYYDRVEFSYHALLSLQEPQ